MARRTIAIPALLLSLVVAAACGDDASPPTDAALADRAVHDISRLEGRTPDASAGDLGAVDGPMADGATADGPKNNTGADGSAADGPVDGSVADGPANPSSDSAPVPAVPVVPHKTDFLNVGCRTHTYGGLSASKRAGCRWLVKKRGYTHFYLYVYNEKDYGGPAFDYYANVTGFQNRLKELIAAGFAPVVWLFPDDAPKLHQTSTAALKAKMSALIPKVDHLVSSYCLGLELDEYWPGSKVNALGQHLRSMTSKKIAVHQTKGKWGFAKYPWVDYMILQYGFNKTTSFIKTMTKQCIADLKKPVVAGEYALDKEAQGVALGNAAVSVGAAGFGNGGTP